MIKKHSWTRREYTTMYRLMRRGYEFEKIGIPPFISFEVLKAADYSYQAKGYDVHGWSNDARRKRFHAIKYRAFAYAEDIPF